MYRDTERHMMELVETHPNGAEEWYCPTCSRRFILQWPPNYKRVILEEGNEDAIHSGGKNGVQMETDRMRLEPKNGVGDGTQSESLPSWSDQEDDGEEVMLSPELRTALNELDWGDWPA